ncbi:MAG: lamin tail domain-containing protein, partial [bacterium]
MHIDISNDDVNWSNLLKIAEGADTNVWQTARIGLQSYDTYNTARIRFRYEDRPNGMINQFNCNFWLDSVQVINYDTIPETVVLNELLVDPEMLDHNNNSNFSDNDEEFIEVYNKTGSFIDVGNYEIQDAIGNNTLSIPAAFTVPDSGYLLLYASGELYVFDVNADTQATGSWLGTWPDLDNTGDTIRLFDDASNELDSKGYTSNDVFPDFSIARLPNGSYNWVNNAFPTPGQDNGAQYIWSIAYAFRDLDSNYVPDLLDSTVTITGVITVPPGIYSDIEAYVQDYSGGVCLFGDFSVPLNYGDSITATGTVDQYRGKNELADFTYTVIGSGTLPDPIDVDGNILSTEYYEGSLVKVKVSYMSGFILEGNQDYIAFDTLNNQFTIWIDSYTNIPGSLAPLDTFTLTGIKGQYTYSSPPNDGYQLMPRDTSDFSHLFTPEIKDIGDVQDVGPDGVSSKYVDSVVTVEGVLTGPNYIFTAGSPSFYIQDSTGGINVYSPEGDSLFDAYIDSLGARFRVTGTVTEYRGLTEVANGYAWFTGMDTVPEPRQILPNWFLTEGMESFLVEMTGVITSTAYQTGDGFNFDVLNGDAGITVRFTTASGINPQSIIKNDKKTFTGIVGQYDPEEPYTTGYQLLLRLPDD